MSTSHSSLPRVSANQLAEFAFATQRQKLGIVHNHKFGNPYCAPYYQLALNGVLRSFRDGHYDASSLRTQALILQKRPARSANESARLRNNATMLLQYASVIPQATPPAGDHEIVRRNAFMPLNGVVISVRPEILTRLHDSHDFSYTKLRFSKSKASADVSELILLILLEYGARQSTTLATFRPEQTILVDCFAQTIHRGHSVSAVRQKQLSAALREYRHLWVTMRHGKLDTESATAAR